MCATRVTPPNHRPISLGHREFGVEIPGRIQLSILAAVFDHVLGHWVEFILARALLGGASMAGGGGEGGGGRR